MPSIAYAADRMVKVTGADSADLLRRVRVARDSELLPASGRSPAEPQVEVEHGAILVFIALSTAHPQLHTGDMLRRLWRLRPRSHAKLLEREPDLFSLHRARLWAVGERPPHFGRAVCNMIEEAADEDGRKHLQSRYKRIAAWSDCHNAGFLNANASAEIFEDIAEDGWQAKRPKLRTITEIDIEVIFELADLVVASRLEARRRGTSIPVSDALRALDDNLVQESETPPQQGAAPTLTTKPEAAHTDAPPTTDTGNTTHARMGEQALTRPQAGSALAKSSDGAPAHDDARPPASGRAAA